MSMKGITEICTRENLLALCDRYFALDRKTSSECIATTLKVASYCTVVFPIIVFVARALLSRSLAINVTKLPADGVAPKEGALNIGDYQIELDVGRDQLGPTDLFKITTHFADTMQERSRLYALINPFEKYLVQPISEKITGPVYESLKAAILPFLPSDPISTEQVLALGEKLEEKLLQQAKQTPSSLPVVNGAHKCLITTARHAYPLVKDLNNGLRIPQKTRLNTEKVFTIAQEEIVNPYAAELKNNEPPASLKDWLIDTAKTVAIDGGVKGVNLFLNSIKGKTTSLLSAKEKAVREKVIVIAADTIGSQVVSLGVKWTIRSAIVLGTLAVLQSIPFEAVGLEGTVVTDTLPWVTGKLMFVAGLALWGKALQPIAQDLQDDFEKEFNPEKGFFSSLPYIQSIKEALPSLRDAIEKIPLPSKYIENFHKRFCKEIIF